MNTFSQHANHPESATMFPSRLRLSALAVLLFAATIASAQTLSANLSGFVNDATDAKVPGAKVTLVNQASKDKRTTISNSSGYFSFTAVPAATYRVEVQRQGFQSFVEQDIELHPSDDRTLTNIKLVVGELDITVTVESASSVILNQGEKSVLITAEDIKRLPVQGRDVTELIKTLPGFAMTAQGSGADNLGPNANTVGGQTQSYTANGVSSEGVQIVSDGVNITDPGNGAGTDQVINMDNVAQVKIQTSNFGADSAKGPIVINAVGKSGSANYHGELYVYGRTYQLNTQDWFSKHDNDAKPDDRYIYPGGNIGGPILIPGTDFNHNRKLTFFAGAEDYVQKNVYAYGSAQTATVNALVPTAAMRAGDFSAQSLANYFGPLASGGIGGAGNVNSPYYLNDCAAGGQLSLYLNICGVPSGTTPQFFLPGTTTVAPNGNGDPINSGQILTRDFDPATQAILNNLIPLPNRPTFVSNVGGSPIGAANSAFNYTNVNLQDQNSYQARARVDYAFSDNNKLYFTYSYQHSNSRNPQQLFYSPQDPFGEINTPSGVLTSNYSNVGSLNYTSVLTPTLTNELYAGSTLLKGGNSPGKTGANLKSTIAYPTSATSPAGTTLDYSGIFPTNQYPQLDDYGFDGLPLGIYPDYSSPIFQNKFTPNGGDNVTKLIKTHTLKFGVYVEREENNQTDLNVASQGQIQNYYDGPNSGPGNIQEADGRSYNTPGNYLASFFLGQVSAFNQFNFQTNSNLYYWNIDTFATDSWKVNKKLTLDYGFRLGHLGPWQDAHNIGFAIFDPKLYASQATTSPSGVTTLTADNLNPGFTWHKINSAIPNSGAGSTLFFFQPRFGIAYDMYGDGKTFFRGGIGVYRSHDGWNDVNQAQATAQGQAQVEVGGGGIMLHDVHELYQGNYVSSAGGGGSGTGNIGFGLQAGDTEQPLTYTYSFSVDQQLNTSTLFELSYQGSQTSHLLTQYEQGAPGDLQNINAIPIGALFKPNPVTGAVDSPQNIAQNVATENLYRAYPYYTQVNVARHILYSNYNALQVQLRRTQGRLQYNANLTWSKNLGIFGSYGTGNVIDSTNLRPNYGPLQGDRSYIANGTVSYDTGAFHHGDRVVRGLLGSYDVASIVNLQSGPNVQRVLSSNFNLQGNIIPAAGVTQTGFNDFPISNVNILGTPDVVLQPKLLCNPGTNLNKGAHQYINGACLAVPDYGVNGPAEIPYIHGPAYFNVDARISKTINLKDRRNLQLQLSAFNVINRPNYSFSSKFPAEQTLYYTGDTLGEATKPTNFGFAQYRFGRRVSEISIKYNF
jgi:hypothetical protein